MVELLEIYANKKVTDIEMKVFSQEVEEDLDLEVMHSLNSSLNNLYESSECESLESEVEAVEMESQL